jgi:hypothetical protein
MPDSAGTIGEALSGASDAPAVVDWMDDQRRDDRTSPPGELKSVVMLSVHGGDLRLPATK